MLLTTIKNSARRGNLSLQNIFRRNNHKTSSSQTNKFNIIVAHTKDHGIGFNNDLPWNSIKQDMDFFKNLTIGNKYENNYTKNAVIMGRKTWESIPNKFKPLPNRFNIIISNTMKEELHNDYNENIKVCRSLDKALDFSYDSPKINDVFVIGGGSIYKDAINRINDLNRLFITEVKQDYEVDTYFPKKPGWIKKLGMYYSDKDIDINVYENMADTNSEEYEYLDCMKDIIENGELIEKDRTGVGTISIFDKNMKFTIKTLEDTNTNTNTEHTNKHEFPIYQVPIMTTKNLFIRGVFEELLWMMRGQTDANILKDKHVHIWDGNTSREYLDSKGLYDYPEGEMGPGYGYQWTNWGGTGINQFEYVIDTLKNEPASRKALVSGWNVADLNDMALEPCHVMYIFKVSGHKLDKPRLNCKVILRSNDMFLGNPFNIMTGTFMTIFLSQILGMVPGQIAMSISDAHIYSNHIMQVQKQLKRVPLKQPYLQITKHIESLDDVLNLSYDDVKLHNYYSWPGIKAPMAV